MDKRGSPEHLRGLIAAGRQAAEHFAEPLVRQPPSGAIPGYEILAEIGRGGMGVVYQARQLSTKQLVAVKVLLSGWFASPSARRRFQREVELTARLQHAGIVRVLGSGLTTTQQQYYAMDYVRGDRLDTWAAAPGRDVQSILHLFANICAAVDHAHQHGVVHRDLKPGNILVDAAGQPHVLDFGLAKATDQAAAEDATGATTSMTGQVVGTLHYLSPEQAAGQSGEIDARTDVYALGVMLYEALTGTLPFDAGGSSSEVRQRICEEPARLPSRQSSRVGRELERVLLKALAKEKDLRYQSAAELADDLGRYLRGEPLRARGPSRLYVVRKKLARHRRHMLVAAVSVLVVVVAVGGHTWWTAAGRRRQRAHERDDARVAMLSVQLDLDGGRSCEAAVSEAAEVHARFPDVTEAWLIEAGAKFRLAEEMGDLSMRDGVVHVLRRAAVEHAEAGWAYTALLADIYAATGNPLADELARQVAQQAPDAPEAWYLRSFATLRREWAVQCVRRATASRPQGTLGRLAWARLGGLREQMGDYEEALHAARELLRLQPGHWEWLLLEGQMLARLHRYEAAADRLSLVVRVAPRTTNTHCTLAGVRLCQRAYTDAIAAYSRADEAASRQSLWPVYRRATAYWLAGDLDSAEADHRDFCERRGHVSYGEARLFLLLHERARRLDLAGREAEAAEVRSRAAQLLARSLPRVPEHSWLHSILACLAGELGPAELVAEGREKGDAAHLCEALYYAGEACLLNGRDDEARRLLRECVDTDVVFDPGSATLDPMNEWHLARWRLERLDAARPADVTDTP